MLSDPLKLFHLRRFATLNLILHLSVELAYSLQLLPSRICYYLAYCKLLALNEIPRRKWLA